MQLVILMVVLVDIMGMGHSMILKEYIGCQMSRKDYYQFRSLIEKDGAVLVAEE